MKRRILFDLDGTVTRTELLPLIAAEIGLADEIETLTRATMDGLLDFRKSFRLRCRLLAEIPVSRVQDIVAAVELDPAIVRFIRAHRAECSIITGNLDCWVGKLVQRELGCALISSTAIVVNDRLQGVAQIIDKGDATRELREAAPGTRIVAVGDGMNDVAMLEIADRAIAFAGLHPPCESVVKSAHYVVSSGDALCRLLSRFPSSSPRRGSDHGLDLIAPKHSSRLVGAASSSVC
jgi:HAD superfamily phosphoserine phosphatase-like hydrolase